MPHRLSEQTTGFDQIELIYKLMTGSVVLDGDTDEIKMCRYLISLNLARAVPRDGATHAIATLNGADLFRRYYNSLTREEAEQKHRIEVKTKGSALYH